MFSQHQLPLLLRLRRPLEEQHQTQPQPLSRVCEGGENPGEQRPPLAPWHGAARKTKRPSTRCDQGNDGWGGRGEQGRGGGQLVDGAVVHLCSHLPSDRLATLCSWDPGWCETPHHGEEHNLSKSPHLHQCDHIYHSSPPWRWCHIGGKPPRVPLWLDGKRAAPLQRCQSRLLLLLFTLAGWN